MKEQDLSSYKFTIQQWDNYHLSDFKTDILKILGSQDQFNSQNLQPPLQKVPIHVLKPNSDAQNQPSIKCEPQEVEYIVKNQSQLESITQQPSQQKLEQMQKLDRVYRLMIYDIHQFGKKHTKNIQSARNRLHILSNNYGDKATRETFKLTQTYRALHDRSIANHLSQMADDSQYDIQAKRAIKRQILQIEEKIRSENKYLSSDPTKIYLSQDHEHYSLIEYLKKYKILVPKNKRDNSTNLLAKKEEQILEL